MQSKRHILAILLSVLVLQLGATALAQTGDDEPEEIEEVEEIEVVEPVAVAPAEGAGDTSLGLDELAGRMHPSVVHMPIAWLILLLLVDIVGLALGRETFAKVGPWLAGLTLLSFVPAVTTGLLRYGFQPYAQQEEGLVYTHRNLMLIVASVVLVAFVLRMARRNRLTGALQWVYLLLIVAAVAIVTYAGHLGGELVYGENYLPF